MMAWDDIPEDVIDAIPPTLPIVASEIGIDECLAAGANGVMIESTNCILYKLDFPNGKSYIGITKSTLDKRVSQHIASSRNPKQLINYAIKKYGDNFHKRILVIGKLNYIKDLEIKSISRFNTISPNGYNLSLGGDTSPTINPLVARKMALSLTGKKKSKEHALNISKGKIGYKASDETKKKLSLANKGKIPSKETLEKRSMALKGRVLSEEHRNKISESLKGKKASDEAKLKMSLAKKGKTGHSMTDEAKAKISNARKGKHLSPITLKAALIANTGRPMHPNTRTALLLANTGRKRSNINNGWKND